MICNFLWIVLLYFSNCKTISETVSQMTNVCLHDINISTFNIARWYELQVTKHWDIINYDFTAITGPNSSDELSLMQVITFFAERKILWVWVTSKILILYVLHGYRATFTTLVTLLSPINTAMGPSFKYRVWCLLSLNTGAWTFCPDRSICSWKGHVIHGRLLAFYVTGNYFTLLGQLRSLVDLRP